MTSKQLDRLLERAVAEAIGVELPRRARRERAPRAAAERTSRRALVRHRAPALEHA